MGTAKTTIWYIFLSMMAIILPSSCSGSSKAKTTDSVDSACNMDSVVTTDSVEDPEAIEDSIAADAEKSLYAIYYDKKMIREPGVGFRYNPAMIEKFKKLGISKAIANPYTRSLKAVIDEVDRISQEVMEKTGDLVGFDSDILWDSQGDVDNFNIVVTKSEVKDPDHVILTTRFTNMDTKVKVFKMVREGGVFKIDDMDDIRKYAAEEIKSSKEYLKNYKTQGEYSGD